MVSMGKWALSSNWEHTPASAISRNSPLSLSAAYQPDGREPPRPKVIFLRKGCGRGKGVILGEETRLKSSEGLGLEEPSCLLGFSVFQRLRLLPWASIQQTGLVYATTLLLQRTRELGVPVEEGVGTKEIVLVGFYVMWSKELKKKTLKTKPRSVVWSVLFLLMRSTQI